MRLLRWLRSGARARAPMDQARAEQLVQRGNGLEDSGDLAAALRCYAEAVELAPRWPQAHLNLGNARLSMGDVERAASAYSDALAHDPDYAPAHYNLGNVHFQGRRYQPALACYRAALRQKPKFVDAEVAQGNVLDALGDFAGAVASYRRALTLRPDYLPVYRNLATALLKQNNLAAALDCLTPILDAQPHNGFAFTLAYQLRCQMGLWSDRDAIEAKLRDLVRRGEAEINPFALLTLEPEGCEIAALQLRAAHQYASRRYSALLQAPPLFKKDPRPAGRLRIGYLSADFHDHATMRLLKGVLAAHDREKISVHAYSYGPVRDAMTERAREACEVFRDISSVSDREAAETIASDGVDILIDLKGYTANARLEVQAARPAPVVVSWLGYPGTLGHPRLADYIIGDPMVSPLAHAADFSEALALMPYCYQPNDRQRKVGPCPTRQEVGLPEKGIVFCSFNQGYKLSPRTLDLWCKIMRHVPGSVLWLLAPDEAFKVHVSREVLARGIEAQRLVLCASLPPEAHLARLQLADLALESYPYTSHTTASDALWMGVPLPTRIGPTFASRVAASLLQAAGVPELIAKTEDEYVDLVTSLALDAERRQSLRNRLLSTRQTCPLFDTTGFTRDLERLYERIWSQYRAGVRESFALQPAPDRVEREHSGDLAPPTGIEPVSSA